MRTKRLMVGLSALLMALAGTITASASASASASVDVARFCVVDPSSEETGCYASMDEAERASITYPTVMLAYEHIDYNENDSGHVWIIKGERPCSEAYDNEGDKRRPQMGYFNNKISSWVTIGSCRVRFWDGPAFGPPMSALSHFYVDCRDMRTCFGRADWNDRAGSLALT